jgi:uncharacterized surface protein with fasciclin (FAS1) repeats
VEALVAAGQFRTLVNALIRAGLAGTLKGKGPFTLFVPTDDAFAKVPQETLEALLKDKNRLRAVLAYHVVAGKVRAADVVKLDSAGTVQGSKINITIKDGQVMVNQARVVKTDLEISDGVIHVIDAVLLPPEGAEQGAAPEAGPEASDPDGGILYSVPGRTPIRWVRVRGR